MASAKSSLGFIEEKLRRALGLVGDIGTMLQPVVTPVAIADDVTRPGCNTFRGRRFAFSQNVGAVAGNSMIGLKAIQSTIITRLWVNWICAAVNNVGTLQTSDSAGDPFALTSLVTPWTELRATSTDFAPIATAAAIPTAGPVARTIVNTITVPTGQGYQQELIGDQGYHLNSGSSLYLTCGVNVTQWTWGFEGRIF